MPNYTLDVSPHIQMVQSLLTIKGNFLCNRQRHLQKATPINMENCGVQFQWKHLQTSSSSKTPEHWGRGVEKF